MASARETPDRILDATDAEGGVVYVPSYSRWFSYKKISEYETRLLPEFFDDKSRGKNPRVYKYYRNSIVKRYRERHCSLGKSGSGNLTFTEVRKILVGDVGSIRRVFDFLETWGLINYSPSSSMPSVFGGINQTSTPAKLDDHASNVSSSITAAHMNSDAAVGGNKKRTCGGCKSACSIACFSCEKYDLTLCARCYVRGNYRTGVSSSDFKRIEISEDHARDWSQKEMLRLLEAITFYGDDWKKVAQYVSGRTDKECIMQFIKLPFGEELDAYSDLGYAYGSYDSDMNSVSGGDTSGSLFPNKKIRLTPLADASNPIMAQAAFLAVLAGDEVAEAAARAAVTTLTDVELGASRVALRAPSKNGKNQDASVAVNGSSDLNPRESVTLEAGAVLDKEELGMEQKVVKIMEVQMKEIQEKIARFEELDLQMEKNWQQFDQLKNLLFVDQLTMLFKNSSEGKAVETNNDIVKMD